MQIKLNAIDFEVLPIEEPIRAAVLSEPVIAQVIWRDVYRWDYKAQTGETLVELSKNGAVPLPNGMAFFIARSDSDAAVAQRSNGPTKVMAKRVLQAVGARNVSDVLRALHKILHMPQKILPLDLFNGINPAASYMLKMYTEFNVVELRNGARNLSFYLLIPGQVSFHHEISAKDDALYADITAANPKVEAPQPYYVIPAHSKANQGIRTLALANRIKAMQADLTRRAEAGEKLQSDALQRGFTAIVGEWRLLTGTSEKKLAQP